MLKHRAFLVIIATHDMWFYPGKEHLACKRQFKKKNPPLQQFGIFME